MTEAGDYRFFAGWRSDPFFFDTQGALNNLQFTGDDFFAEKDVCSIVLEVPNSALGSEKDWPMASHTGRHGREMGPGGSRRATRRNLYSLPVSEKEPILLADPADDARFVAVFAHSLEHTGGYSPEEATRVARTLLPDILSYDPKRPASYPANGRTLSDDVMDVFLSILTNGKVTRDNVGPHNDLLARSLTSARRTRPDLRNLIMLDAHALEPSGRRFHVAEDLGRRTDTFGQNRYSCAILYTTSSVVTMAVGPRSTERSMSAARRTSRRTWSEVISVVAPRASINSERVRSRFCCSRSKCALMSWNVTMPSA